MPFRPDRVAWVRPQPRFRAGDEVYTARIQIGWSAPREMYVPSVTVHQGVDADELVSVVVGPEVTREELRSFLHAARQDVLGFAVRTHNPFDDLL